MSNRLKKQRTAKKLPEKQAAIPVTKTDIWTVPTVLSLVVGVIGLVGLVGLVALRPQLAMSPLDALATGQPFSAPFELTNTGLLGIHIRNVTVVIHDVQYKNGTVLDIQDGTISGVDWDNFDLGREESKTIMPYLANGRPEKADIVIAVDYRYLGFNRRWLFRFEGIHMDNWHWNKQPVGNLEAEINKVVDDGLMKHQTLHPN